MKYTVLENPITSFVKPTPPTNIVTNETITTQYNINQGLKVFGKKVRLQYKKKYSSFMIAGLSNLRKPKTSVINIGEGFWHI